MAGFGIVAILGISAFVLTIGTFSKRLSAPFGMSSVVNDSSPQVSLDNTKDTDKDGIADIYELQVYRTSPFLEDSDSDGVLDKDEIDAGEDPNCPKGRDCSVFILPSVRETEQKEITQKLYETTIISKLAQTGIPGITDGETLRNFLRQAGVAEEVLNQFSNEELVKIIQEGSGGGQAQTGAAALPENPGALAIRDLLIKAGMDKTVLDKFSDEQIVKIYKETLKNF